MDATDAIKQMMSESGTNASQLSAALGKHRNFVTTTFSKGSTPRVDTFARMADAMGYEVVVRKRGGGDGCFVIASDD